MSTYITPPSTGPRPASPPEDGTSSKTYRFSNECTMDLHASPFILSALNLKIADTDIVGIGSVVPTLTLPISKGEILYNDADDFGENTNLRFKIFLYIDPQDGMFRIDFNKNVSEHFENDDFGNIESPKYYDTNYGSDLKKVAERLQETSDYPDMVFKGEIPAEYPRELSEPLFGVLTFENISLLNNS